MINNLLRKVSFVFIVKLCAVSVNFLMSMLVARKLGLTEAGYFFFGFSVVNLLSVIARQGYDLSIVKHLGILTKDSCDECSSALLVLLLRVFLVASFIGGIFYIFADGLAINVFNMPGVKDSLSVAILVLIPFSLLRILAHAFLGMRSGTWGAIFLNLSTPLFFLISLIFIEIELAVQAMNIYLVCSLVSFILSLIIWKLHFGIKIKNVQKGILVNINQTAKKMFPNQVLTIFYQWGNVLLIGLFLPASDISLFTAAQKTAVLMSFLLISVNAVISPEFASSYEKKDYRKIRSLFLFALKILAFSGSAALFFTLVFATEIMSVFGEGFHAGSLLLIIMALGQFINNCTGPVGVLLQMSGNEMVVLRNTMISCAIIFIGGFVFIPIYGVISAAVVLSIALSVQNLLALKYLIFDMEIFSKNIKQ